ncbi:hypothetical protein Sliba_50550 [Streptomyces nigrescens]|uniref:Uncharacterized protein n=1 Tax=Streptomyces nigrescens TaxID=1920 RepID=A0A640TNV5_STRNI|nr:hypothetical protein Sliba_50550 [Streptomyces libani subsp. libani]GGV94780.1 hypothetical protein GCM10010500_33490 [Streptomyces libani subsp. libani]
MSYTDAVAHISDACVGYTCTSCARVRLVRLRLTPARLARLRLAPTLPVHLHLVRARRATPPPLTPATITERNQFRSQGIPHTP